MPRLARACLGALALLALAAGCTSNDAPGASRGSGTSGPPGTGASQAASATSIFGQGCPTADQSLARQLDATSGPMQGARAVGGPGDFLLANDHAAFVVSGPVTAELPQRTWWHYGGIVVDAAAVDGCNQVSPDRIDEVGLVVGKLNINEFPSSILRAFRADEIEVLNDGRDGQKAVVRATGSDDLFQLIEYQLIRASADAGKTKPKSSPFGLRIEVDYTLEPGDPVLQITLRIVAETDGARAFLGSALVTWGDEVEAVTRPESEVSVGGFGLQASVPWQVASGDGGSYAFAASDANQAIAAISGVNAFIDANQALEKPMAVEKAGDAREMTFLLAASPTDANHATQALVAQDDELGPGPSHLVPVSGQTVDAEGKAVPKVRLDLQMRRPGGEWKTYDVAMSDENGRYDASVAVLQDAQGADPALRLHAVADGRAPVDVDLPTASGASGTVPAATTDVRFGPAGALDVNITDDRGDEVPARVTLSQQGKVVDTIDVAKRGAQPVAPGTYDAVVSHGYEFDRVETTVTVPAGGSAPLAAKLVRSVDTDGWIAIDTHVHSSPSTDSTVNPERRFLDAAVTGVEVVVNTNHEIIQDLSPQLQSSGLAAWVASITGQEVTASSPEHTTAYPFVPDGSVRGGNPRWYGHDLGEIYELEKERGAAIRGLNHPSGYLKLIGWDPVTSTAKNTDPSPLGLDPGKQVWSWDFEQVELQNGTQQVLRSDADAEGLFDFWQGAINHGKRITAVAASDAHDLDMGKVMTFVRVADDDPARITPEQIVDAVKQGRAVLSTGAFASVDIAGATPGETAKVQGGKAELKLRVQAARGIDVTKVLVFANCDLVQTVAIEGTDGAVRFDGTVPLDLPADANITVVGFGDQQLPTPFHDANPARVPRFTTNPVFVDVDGNGSFDPPGDKSCTYPR